MTEILKGLPRYDFPLDMKAEATSQFYLCSDVEKALGGWVSIRKKPKRGTLCAIEDADGRVVAGYANDLWAGGFCSTKDGEDGVAPCMNPSRWMPLPVPPKETA